MRYFMLILAVVALARCSSVEEQCQQNWAAYGSYSNCIKMKSEDRNRK